MPDWRLVYVGGESDKAEIGVTRIWQEAWRETDSGTIDLPEPNPAQQIRKYRVYEIGPLASPIRFAARELSNGVWGLYIPMGDWRYRVLEVVPGPGPGTVVLLAGTTDLPAGIKVSVTLNMPNGDTIETPGAKEWELPVSKLWGKDDAFRLLLFEGSIPQRTLAEIHT